MPYLASGQSLKKFQKKRLLYRKLILKLENTHEFIVKYLPDLSGISQTRHRRHQRDLESRYSWTVPLDKFDVEVAIQSGLDRLKGMLLEGGYGYYNGLWLAPNREGDFTFNLSWGYGYLTHFDPYYYYSYDYPFFGGYYGGYFQSYDVDKVYLQLNAELDDRDKERFEMTVYDDRIHEALDTYGIIASIRMAYINYCVEVFRIKRDYDKSEWNQKIAALKSEGVNAQLDQGLLELLDGIMAPEIF